MSAITSISTVSSASSADLDTVQGTAATLMLKRSIDIDASAATQLIDAIPSVPLATSGSLGTRVNTFA